jgi:hypothetical protein
MRTIHTKMSFQMISKKAIAVTALLSSGVISSSKGDQEHQVEQTQMTNPTESPRPAPDDHRLSSDDNFETTLCVTPLELLGGTKNTIVNKNKRILRFWHLSRIRHTTQPVC